MTNDGQRIRVYFANAQGQPCQTEQAILSQPDGFIAQGQQTLTGPGCDVCPARVDPAPAVAGLYGDA